MLLQQRQETGIVEGGGVQGQLDLVPLGIGLRGFAALVGIGIALYRGDIQNAAFDLQLGHLVALNHVDHVAVGDFKAGGLVGHITGISTEIIENHRQHHGPGQQCQHTAKIAVVLSVFVVFIV